MNLKTFIGLSLMCSFLIPAVVMVHSSAWGGCSVQDRIELGKQGYDKTEVEKACTEAGENFWETLGKGLGAGIADSLTRKSGKQEHTSTGAAPATPGAQACVTNAGTCPLPGGPVGYPCYCRAWNGVMFTGLSK